MDKKILIEQIRNEFLNEFQITECNIDKPWGAYFCIQSTQIGHFIERFFGEIKNEFPIETRDMLSPKLLIVLPQKRLSWQYHFKREEFWKILKGDVSVPLSQTDEEPQTYQRVSKDSLVRIPQEMRHRLIGTDMVGVVAEIWRHTDKHHLSDEQDIVRVQDDFQR